MPRTSSSGFAGIHVTDLWKKNGRRSGNRWWVRVTLSTGRFDSSTYPDEPGMTRHQVAMRANQERADVEAGRQTLDSANLRTLGTAYVKSLRARGKNESYARHVERVVDALERRGVTDVKAPTFAAEVEEWVGNLKANWWAPRGHKFKRKTMLALSGSLRNRIVRELRSILNKAKDSHVIAHNPLDGISAFDAEPKARTIPTVTEVRTLVSPQFQRDPWWLPFCLLTYTGCRVEEALHLEWSDIDLANNLVHVRYKPGVYALKHKRERSLPLQPELAAILNPLFKVTGGGFIVEDERMRSNGSCAHLLDDREPAKRKKVVHHDYSPAFRRYLRRCKLTEARRDVLTPHCLRHWWISSMLATGAAWDDVMEWAGHSQSSTTLKYRAMKKLIAKDVASWTKGEFFLRREVPSVAAPAQVANAKPPAPLTGTGDAS